MTLYIIQVYIITCVKADNSSIDTDNIENITCVLTIEKVESRLRNVYTSHKCKF